MTLANICNRSGTYINLDMWAGKQNQTFMTGYKWPNQGWPMKKDWILWQLALQKAFLVNHLLCLDQLLGLWLQSPQQSNHQWHWVTSYSTQKLYHWTGRWQIHAWHWGHSNRKNTNSLLKCYHSMPYLTKKTHTGSFYWLFRLLRGLLLFELGDKFFVTYIPSFIWQ